MRSLIISLMFVLIIGLKCVSANAEVYKDQLVSFEYDKEFKHQIRSEWDGRILRYIIDDINDTMYGKPFYLNVEVSTYDWYEKVHNRSISNMTEDVIGNDNYEDYNVENHIIDNEKISKIKYYGVYQYTKLFDNNSGRYAIIRMSIPTLEECYLANQYRKIYESWTMSQDWFDNNVTIDDMEPQAFSILNIDETDKRISEYAPHLNDLYYIAQDIIRANAGFATFPSLVDDRSNIEILTNGNEAEVKSFFVLNGKAYNYDVEFSYQENNGRDFTYDAYYIYIDGKIPEGVRKKIK